MQRFGNDSVDLIPRAFRSLRSRNWWRRSPRRWRNAALPASRGHAAIARARTIQPGAIDFAGMPVLRVETLDGIKFFLDNPEAKSKPNAAETWLLLRASGTEPLMRIYSESVSKKSVNTLLESARQFALTSA